RNVTGVQTCALPISVVKPGDRSTARADLDDVHDGDLDGISGKETSFEKFVLRADLRVAVFDQRTFGRGAADVHGDDVGLLDQLPDHGGAHHPGDRPGFDQIDRPVPGRTEWRGASV